MRFDLEKYVVEEASSIKDALTKVEANHEGIIFTRSTVGKITGVATDGDIRRGLLRGLSLADQISDCANRDYVWASEDTSRENLLKRLDGSIKLVPVLDRDHSLVSIVSKDFVPLNDEEKVFIRARAPVRVSFGGGGSDITGYFSQRSGAVLNSTISIYSHAAMEVLEDPRIEIFSIDLGEKLIAANLAEAFEHTGVFGLIVALLQVVKPDFGFRLHLHSDFAVGSGLGGSATLSAAILGCFNMLRTDRWDRHELAEIAFQAERLHLGIAGGWQDQYAAAFGGFNFIEFGGEQNLVHPIRLHQDVIRELEESLVLCDTGTTHESGAIHQDQSAELQSEAIQKNVEKNVELAYEIRNLLLRGNLNDFGLALGRAWSFKKTLSSKITTTKLDEIYDGAIQAGALGGKLLGAGGGGFFLFFVPPFKKNDLLHFLIDEGLAIRNFNFEAHGLQSWISRASSDSH